MDVLGWLDGWTADSHARGCPAFRNQNPSPALTLLHRIDPVESPGDKAACFRLKGQARAQIRGRATRNACHAPRSEP